VKTQILNQDSGNFSSMERVGVGLAGLGLMARAIALSRPERWGHKPQDEYFLHEFVQGKNTVKLQDAKKALKMSLASLESSQTGKTVFLDF
jgi:hypothetical protein